MTNSSSKDTPIKNFLSKVADLVLLNFLILFTCIPVITIGASLTAGHYAALKILREEGYVWKNFLKSFKENFIQATLIWLILLAHLAIAAICLAVTTTDTQSIIVEIIRAIVIVGIIISVFVTMWVFPLQSKFVNNIGGTLKNAILMAYRYIFRTLYMVLLFATPVSLAFVLRSRWQSLLILFGLSVPIYLCALAYNKIFEKHERKIIEMAQS